MPGEGVEPSRPARGHLILSQARMTSFATPAERSVLALRAAGYWPGVIAVIGNRSGPLPRNASLKAANAFSSKRVPTAMCPSPQ